jgi:glycosyltransferase involved in cell wall biosynthesis
MKVLQIHGTDAAIGGGPIAMLRLQEGVRKAGVDSRILCVNPTQADSVAFPRVRGESRLRAFTWRLGLRELHCLSTFRIQTLNAYNEADVLHLHGLHGGFFNYLGVPWLTKSKPAVYTLHDMWPFTGHCVYSFDCNRWKNGCGRCPYPQLPNPIQRDATWLEWRLKAWGYRRSNVTVIAPSTWMHDLAQQSMLNHLPIVHIPHGVDTDAYRPLDQEKCRSALGIPNGKKVLLYIVRRMNPSHKAFYVKGGDLLVKALEEVPYPLRSEIVLLLLGEGSEDFARELNVTAIPLGFVSSDPLKAMAYCAADVFVYPTRADNSPLVLLESLACGTPVVSFNVGGVPDLVRPGQTGFLAEPENPKQLSERIAQVLEDGDLRARLSSVCRAIAVKEYPMDLHISRHVLLYRQALQSVHA